MKNTITNLKFRAFLTLVAVFIAYGSGYANITYPNGNTNTVTNTKTPNVTTGLGGTYNLLMEGEMPNRDGQDNYSNHGIAKQGTGASGYISIIGATVNYFNNYGANDNNVPFAWISGGGDTNSSSYCAIRMRLASGVTAYPNLEFGFHENCRDVTNGTNHKNYTAWTSNGVDALPALTNSWQWIVFKTENCCGGSWKRIYIKGGTGIIEISDAYYCETMPVYPGYICGVPVQNNAPTENPTLKGSPWAVDTQIDWWNFDNGGEGCGFHRESTQNNGNAGFRGSGFTLDGGNLPGWSRPNAWLGYTFQVTQSGCYSFTTNGHKRNGNDGDYIRYKVYQNGVQAGSDLVSAAWGNSGDLHNVTSTTTINLNAGTYQLRTIVAGGNGDNYFAWHRINTVYVAPASVTVSGTSSYEQDDTASPLLANTTGGAGTHTYQWYSNTANSNEGGTLAGNGTTYTPSTANTGTVYFYCVVGSTGCGSAKSAPFAVTVNEASCSEADSKTLYANPTTVCAGADAVVGIEWGQNGVTYALFDNNGQVGANTAGNGTNPVEWTVNPTATTTYTLRIIKANGFCAKSNLSTAEVSVNIVAPPVIAETETCRGDLNNLTIDDKTDCYWQTTAEGTSTEFPAFSGIYYVEDSVSTGTPYYLRKKSGGCWSGAESVIVKNSFPGNVAPEYNVVTLQGKSECSAATDYIYDNSGALALSAANIDAAKWFEIPAEDGYFYYKNVVTKRYLYYPGGNSNCGGTNGDWSTYTNILTLTPPSSTNNTKDYQWISSESGGCAAPNTKTFLSNRTTEKDLVGNYGSSVFTQASGCIPGLAYKQHQHNTYQIKKTIVGTAKDGVDEPEVNCPYVAFVTPTVGTIGFVGDGLALSASSNVENPVYTYYVRLPNGEYDMEAPVVSPYIPSVPGKYHFRVAVCESGTTVNLAYREIEILVKQRITVRALVPTQWNSSNIHVHYWGGATYNGELPAAALEQYQINCRDVVNIVLDYDGTTPISMMFVNGTNTGLNLNVTLNIDNIISDTIVRISEDQWSCSCEIDKKHMVYAFDLENAFNADATVTVYAQKPSVWMGVNGLYVHYWNDCGADSWESMSPCTNDNTCDWYSATITGSPVNILFGLYESNPADYDLTVNIPNVVNNAAYAIGSNDGKKNVSSASVPSVCNNPTGIEELVGTEISVFPNPASDMLYISGISENQTVTLCALTGQTLISHTGSVLNIGALPQGVYLVKVGGRVAKVVKK